MITTHAKADVSHTLTIRINRYGVAFADYSPFSREVPRFEWFEIANNTSQASALKKNLEASELASCEYRHVEVLIESPYTLVPLSEFSEDEVEEVFHFNFNSIRDASVHYDILPTLGAALIYGADTLTESLLEKHFSDIRIYCTGTGLIRHFMERCRVCNYSKIFAYIHDHCLELVIFKNGKLHLANRYHVETLDDICYFTLLAFNQLQLNNDTDEIFVVADKREEQEEAITRLQQFVPNVYPINPGGEFNRHPLTRIKGLAYDQLVFMLRQY